MWPLARRDAVRSAGQACCCLDRLYAFGGTDQNQRVHSSLEGYNPEAGGSWIFRKSMQVPRMDFGSCVLSDSIMVGGGQHGEVLASTEFYRPELDDWQLGPPLLSPRYGHQLLLVNL
ncbi:Kelch-like ECH-associated protein 1 [Symbiodinium microadriaticum]|uniref:Kelch-like ECH-associated protein 1 n=1 Tax=Symbiodinium microadriaticum TaxID=2951 RepID=A0A1Q9CJJ0_SYMMI|nr:Kelch-like ECH-associated protein 1 [Symbiodinium microadriaticum]